MNFKMNLNNKRKILILLTDGEPIAHTERRGELPQQWLMRWTRDIVRKVVNTYGIPIYSIMINPKLTDKIMYETYGNSKRWTKINDINDLEKVLMNVIIKNIISVIRRT